MIAGALILAAFGIASAAPASGAAAYRVTSRNTNPVSNSGAASPSVSASHLYFTIPSPMTNELRVWDGDWNRSTLVAEMNAGPVAELRGAAFFLATRAGVSGLWTTDGTSSGTRLVREVGAYGELTLANELLFFLGDGSSLWRSDGTTAGTFALPAIGTFGVERAELVALGRDLIFVESDPKTGVIALSKTRGTATSTQRLAEIGQAAEGYRFYYGLTVVGDRVTLLVGGDDGFELWGSDGTPGGTAAIARFVGDGGSVCPGYCPALGPSHPAGDLGLFFANDGVHGRELWRTNGTAAGTRLVRDIAPGPASSDGLYSFSQSGFISGTIGGIQLLAADDGVHGTELWRSDGTEAGTYLVADLIDGQSGSDVRYFARAGGSFFFSANGEVWRSDGTSAGTGRFEGLEGFPLEMTDGGISILSSTGLWRSDGANVELVDDGEQPLGLEINSPVSASGAMFFTDFQGRRLWVSDGTDAGTHTLGQFSQVGDLRAAAGRIYFVPEGHLSRGEPWISDGTEAGTRSLATMPNSAASEFTGVGRNVFFSASDEAHGQELWATDGTDAGTRLVADATPGPQGSDPYALTAAGDLIYYLTFQPGGLWRSDGTAAGTLQLAPIAIEVNQLAGAGSTLFAFAYDGSILQLWTSDGSPAGTKPVGARFAAVAQLAPSGEKLFFNAATTTPYGELWVSDGTLDGTRLLRAFSAISSIVSAGDGTVFVSADDGENGFELWKSDGTPEGTALVRDIFPGPASSNPTSMLAVGGVVLFSAQEADHGRELWVSDGSFEGTRLVEDVYPGVASSSPTGLTQAGPRIFFRATDAETGPQLWAIPAEPFGSRPSGAPRRPRTAPPRN